MTSEAIEPFAIAVPPETLDDLRARLRATRFPSGVTTDGGVPLDELRAVLHHWAHEFDWTAHERAVNALPQFRATVDDARIHFVHRRATRADAVPILLLHGWPGSFIEMRAVVALLAPSFHVVVPSLPGFGFSDAPAAPGMSNARMAERMAALMTMLGYERFVVHGGDVGAGVGTWLALRHPHRVTALHLNFIPGSYAPFVEGDLTPEEKTFHRTRAAWSDQSGAYGHVQRTRPLTLAYALDDSPAGLAAWIIEKFREWADPRSDIPLDTILTNVTLYWVTRSIGPSMRVYLESARTPLTLARSERVRVPTAVARFPYELPMPPRSWVERGYEVARWSEMPRGGHFAALEAPELLAGDIAAFTDPAGGGRGPV